MQTSVGRGVLLGILLLLASSEFLLRGPVRFVHNKDFNDLISPYIQSEAWSRGLDPYRSANLIRLWPSDAARPDSLANDLADNSLVYKHGIPTAYPLTCFLILAPLAFLPWHIAHSLWLALTVLAYAATVLSLISLAGLRRSPRSMYLFLAFALALAPVHTGLSTGSIVIVAVGLVAGSVWAADRQRVFLAGVLLALAVGLKPQIGLPFVFYFALRRRWRTSGLAIALVALLSALAVIRLSISGVPWLQNYLYDNKVLFAPGSLGDFTELDPIRFGLINLQVPIYAIFGHRQMATLQQYLSR
ncbi:MAG: glycosyltransferase family 87 protein [Terriglobales bacterium]